MDILKKMDMKIEKLTRKVLIEKIPVIKKIIVPDSSDDLINHTEIAIDDFIYKKSIEEIKIELKHILFTHKWIGKCPVPLGTAFHFRLMMQMYIPNEFKHVCEQYLDEYWDELNERQRNLLEEWSY